MKTYPNLELLEYKVSQAILSLDSVKEKFAEMKNKCRYISPDFEAIMFPQIWGSTCTGFDEMPDGTPTFGGCAITKEYTTVFREINTETYCICFGGKPCYIVENPNERFLSDINNRSMASLHESKELY